MDKLPDAPWIVEAETKGIPCADPPECPVCGKRCETIYIRKGTFNADYGLIMGCDKCIKEKDAWDWQEENKEDENE